MSETIKIAADQVTEEDLKKSLAQLEGKTEEKPAATEPVVVTSKMEKTAAKALEETASAGLKQVLEVSDVLREVTNLQGLHVDNTLEVLQKSIQEGAERDLAVIRILQNMQKSIQDLAGKVEEFGKTPVGKVVAPVQTVQEQILLKSAADKKSLTKGQVLSALEGMAKSASNAGDEAKYTNALIKFDSTGQISDQVLLEVQREWKRVAA